MRALSVVLAGLLVVGCGRSSESGSTSKDEVSKEKEPKKKAKEKPADEDDEAKPGKKKKTPDDVDEPASAKGGDGSVVDLAMGHYRACVVRADGRAVCWGKSFLEGAPPEAPTVIAGLDDATQIAGDDGLFCARRKGGAVSCFGADLRAKPVAGVASAVETDGSCARTDAGKVVCWTIDDAGKATLETIAVAKPKALGGGTSNSCVIDEAGDAFCWGDNRYHQLGDGTTEERKGPVKIKKLAGVDEIGASTFERTCARTGGKVLCWGGEARTAVSPTPLKGLADAAQLAIGEYHSCARLATGKIACWGSNSHGQLGVEGVDSADEPVIAKGVDHVARVAVGGGEPAGGAGSTCVLVEKGDEADKGKKKQEVLCWGAMNEKKTPTKVDLASAKPAGKADGKAPKG